MYVCKDERITNVILALCTLMVDTDWSGTECSGVVRPAIEIYENCEHEILDSKSRDCFHLLSKVNHIQPSA